MPDDVGFAPNFGHSSGRNMIPKIAVRLAYRQGQLGAIRSTVGLCARNSQNLPFVALCWRYPKHGTQTKSDAIGQGRCNAADQQGLQARAERRSA